MHVQSVYALGIPEARRVIGEHGWARVVTHGEGGLRATYGFFLLDEPAGDEIVVRGHFARADPQAADIERGVEALVMFDGPYGYISASWYRPEITRIPSTWNHISVHLHGVPEVIDGDEKFDLLRRTLEHHEASEPDPWRLEGEGLEFSRQQLAKSTIAFRLRATSVEAKAKLSQKMPREVRERIIGELDADGPHANGELAELMRRHTPDDVA